MSKFCGRRFLIIVISFLSSIAINGNTENLRIKIPSAEIRSHGIFELSADLAFVGDENFTQNGSEIEFDFGLFDRVNFSIRRISDQNENDLFTDVIVEIFSEKDLRPAIAIGFQSHDRSTFLALTKSFNLPKIHILKIDLGTEVLSEINDNRIGVFGDLRKQISPSWLRGDLNFQIGANYRGLKTIANYEISTGLKITIGAEILDDQSRVLFGVAFTNAAIIKQIREAKLLAKQAARLASQSKK